jgi:hypothetical protein
MTATYLRYGRGKSRNALFAEAEGRFTASVWARRIGKGVLAADIKNALPFGEWHHVGKFASECRYFSEEEIEEAMGSILAARDLRKSQSVKEGGLRRARVEWKTFTKSGYRWICEEHVFEGDVQVTGDVVSFKGMRKRLSGKNITITYLPPAPTPQSN